MSPLPVAAPDYVPERVGLLQRFREDIASAKRLDPASGSTITMLLTYPGLHAIWMHRLIHRIWIGGGPQLLARILAYITRMWTGIEIHPAARIGRRFFIDHGIGVVIGETAEVGNDVMLYHGVTLGGRSLNRVKRHPTLCDDVVVGSGARVLGPVVIGARSQVGANAVVVKDVPPDSVAVGIPARVQTPADVEPELMYHI